MEIRRSSCLLAQRQLHELLGERRRSSRSFGGERTRRGGGDGLGLIEDPATGRRRVVWALIIVLTYSRHSFVWPTFSQKLVDVIDGGLASTYRSAPHAAWNSGSVASPGQAAPKRPGSSL